jgi:hypothetical protein
MALRLWTGRSSGLGPYSLIKFKRNPKLSNGDAGDGASSEDSSGLGPPPRAACLVNRAFFGDLPVGRGSLGYGPDRAGLLVLAAFNVEQVPDPLERLDAARVAGLGAKLAPHP